MTEPNPPSPAAPLLEYHSKSHPATDTAAAMLLSWAVFNYVTAGIILAMAIWITGYSRGLRSGAWNSDLLKQLLAMAGIISFLITWATASLKFRRRMLVQNSNSARHARIMIKIAVVPGAILFFIWAMLMAENGLWFGTWQDILLWFIPWLTGLLLFFVTGVLAMPVLRAAEAELQGLPRPNKA